VHSVPAPPDLPDLREVLATRIDDAALTPQRRGFALQLLADLPSGDRLCHGDYHPGNVLVAADRVTVIDWAGAARGIPEADHARSLLLLRWADPLPDTALMSRGLISAGRAIFARTYARTYRDGSNLPLRQVNSWLVVHVAARISEGIDVERPKLTEILDRARSQAAR
jgi:aminoglycoside phosphotransferase (APT) family kinase protein